jgi:hypothetical protein
MVDNNWVYHHQGHITPDVLWITLIHEDITLALYLATYTDASYMEQNCKQRNAYVFWF